MECEHSSTFGKEVRLRMDKANNINDWRVFFCSLSHWVCFGFVFNFEFYFFAESLIHTRANANWIRFVSFFHFDEKSSLNRTRNIYPTIYRLYLSSSSYFMCNCISCTSQHKLNWNTWYSVEREKRRSSIW